MDFQEDIKIIPEHCRTCKYLQIYEECLNRELVYHCKKLKIETQAFYKNRVYIGLGPVICVPWPRLSDENYQIMKDCIYCKPTKRKKRIRYRH